MAAGLRSQIRAQVMSVALDDAGLLEPDLAAALQAVQDTSQSLIWAGTKLAQTDALGTLFDAIA